MPKFSVVVPVYNVEDYLNKCVCSILNQEEDDYELLLVDDGSTDSSGTLCDKIKAENSGRNIQVIHQQNKGLGGARNTGIDAARGEYLFFIDSDDTIAPGTFKALFSYVETHSDVDIVCFDIQKVDENGNPLYIIPAMHMKNTYGSVRDNHQLLLADHAAWNKIIRRSLFTDNNISFPERLWFEDLATIIKLYPAAKNIGYIPEVFYFYLQREGSIMNSTKCDRNIEMITAYDTVLQYYKEKGLFEEFYSELEYIAAFHVYYLSSIRVMNLNRHHKLLDLYKEYVYREFPDLPKNKYLGRKEKVIISLLDRKMYKTIQFIFKVKGVVNRLLK